MRVLARVLARLLPRLARRAGGVGQLGWAHSKLEVLSIPPREGILPGS